MADAAHLDLVHHGPVAVARIEGEIDTANADALRGEIAGAVANDDDGVVLDLTACSYLDSAGLRVVFELARRLGARNQRLAIAVQPGSPLLRLFDIVELARVVPLHDDVDAAIAAVEGHHTPTD